MTAPVLPTALDLSSPEAQARAAHNRALAEDLRARVAGPAERGAARLSQLQCAVRVLVHEYALDGDLAGRVGVHQFGHVAVDVEQPPGHGALADSDAAARHVADAALPRVHDAVARDPRSGIEAEDAHHASYDNGSP